MTMNNRRSMGFMKAGMLTALVAMTGAVLGQAQRIVWNAADGDLEDDNNWTLQEYVWNGDLGSWEWVDEQTPYNPRGKSVNFFLDNDIVVTSQTGLTNSSVSV